MLYLYIMKYKVTNITYDTDGENIELPETLDIDVPDNINDPYERVEYISDEISNITGFCHKGFTTEPQINE